MRRWLSSTESHNYFKDYPEITTEINTNMKSHWKIYKVKSWSNDQFNKQVTLFNIYLHNACIGLQKSLHQHQYPGTIPTKYWKSHPDLFIFWLYKCWWRQDDQLSINRNVLDTVQWYFTFNSSGLGSW